jgi:4-amino-4-deoxy-L-arabinose transferase-like glycosyltransferase
VSPARRRVAVGAILALALALRLLVIIGSPHFTPQTDSHDYDRTAASLASSGHFPSSILAPTGGPTAFRPPAFPVLLAATYAVTGTAQHPHDRWEAGRLAEAALGVLSVWLVILLASVLWGETVALAAGGVAAVSPPLLLAGSSLMSESLFVPLVLAAVLAALRGRGAPRPVWWAVASGVLTGLAALTRGNGFVLLLPVCLLLWPSPWRRWRSLRDPALAILAALLVCVPWTVRNLHVFGQPVAISTESGYALAGTYNALAQADSRYPALWFPPVLDQAAILRTDPGLNEAQISDRLTSRALHYIRVHPISLPRTVLWSTLRMLNLTGTRIERFAAQYEAYPMWLTDLSVYSFWVLLGGLVLGAAGGALRRAPAAVWLVPVILIVSGLPFSGATRYRVPADPFLIMFAVVGIAGLAERRAGLRSPLPSPGAWAPRS